MPEAWRAGCPRSPVEDDWRISVLAGLPGEHVWSDEPLSRHTSFRIGGPADLLVAPTSVAGMKRVIDTAGRLGVPLTTIGNGSNLLVRDGGIRGIVLKIADNLAGVTFTDSGCRAEAGAPLAAVSRAACVRGLGGLEFACGIPGTIGGGVMMNAGAYGGELKDVVTGVEVFDGTGRFRTLSPDELQFSYRTSVLQRTTAWVLAVEMALRPEPPERLLGQVSRNQYLRESKQPLEWPSAGSIFKRPKGHYVGPMIEKLGLKGYRIGGACVSPKHAGFIVNLGGATAADVLAIIARVRELVMAEFGVALETEVRIIGEEGEPPSPETLRG